MSQNKNGGCIVQFAVFRIDAGWYRLPSDERDAGIGEFLGKLKDGIVSHLYLLSGLKAGADLLVWRVAESIEDLQRNFLSVKRTTFGRHLVDAAIYTGVTKSSTYTSTENSPDFLKEASERRKYLSFYPFTKTNEWYLMDYESRRRTMSEHISIGRRYPEVSQTLVYSFGADDQEFVVAYEMDDLAYYIDCVMALRESESRRYTKSDTPVYTGIRTTEAEFISLFGGKNER